MNKDEIQLRSCWMLRAKEWNDAKARYPNLWHEGMPRHILGMERMAGRMRLGDLVVVYYPASTRHPERSERFLGISRVAGLRRADEAGHAWVDLETAHRFAVPLQLSRVPRYTLMCCDPDWPEEDVTLCREVLEAAVSAGWSPLEGEVRPEDLRRKTESEASVGESGEPPAVADEAPAEAPPPPAVEEESAGPVERLFAGADFGGAMRDPRDSTWLAMVGLAGGRLSVMRLEATGRSGLQASLRNPDRGLMQAEAVGLSFPFGLPLPFAESLLGEAFPEEGWWALARRLEKMSWPDYLSAMHEFRDERGEIKRLADERAGAPSPLRRVDPDMGSRTYHGIRMIAQDRSRFAVRPFESAQGKLLFEVSPEGAVSRLGLAPDSGGGTAQSGQIISALEGLAHLPLSMNEAFGKRCRGSRDALDAVIAARCAAVAVLTSEADRTPEELAPEAADQVRREGWIYGLEEPS